MTGQHAYVLYETQIGVENTPNTAVGANVILRSFEILPKPINATEMLRQMGSKISTDQVAVKGSKTDAKIQGFADFNGLAYLYSILFKAGTVTTPAGGTISRQWQWLLQARQPEFPVTATVENGVITLDTGRFACGNLTNLKTDFELKTAPKLSGDMLGTLFAEEGVTPTANPTEVPCVPCPGGFTDYYIGDTLAAVTTGTPIRAADVMKGSFDIGGRRKDVYSQRSDQVSFSGLVETENKVTVHLELEKNSVADTLMRQARQAKTRYIRLVTTGPVIEGAIAYLWEIIMPFKVNSPDRGNSDDVYCAMYDLECVNDPVSLGGYLQIRLINALTALATSVDLSAGQQPAALIAAALIANGTGSFATTDNAGFGYHQYQTPPVVAPPNVAVAPAQTTTLGQGN